jgi:hypothetical protein
MPRAPRAYRPTEKAIEAAIIRNLRELGLFVSKNSQPQRVLASAGTPDLTVLSARWKLHLFVEVKKPGGRVSTAQAVWHREARAAGLNVVVAHSTEEVLEALCALGAPISFHARKEADT